MAEINKQAPEFNVDAFHEGKIKKIKLSDYKGKWVVLVFYPGDFTFVCPTELGEVADLYSEFQKINTEILSVSTDTAFVHKAWFDKSPTIKKIKYPMLADPTGKTCKAYGTYIEEGADEGQSLRGTFIINPQGILKAIEINDNDIGRNAHELLRKVQAAQFTAEHGVVCPASWQPGKDTLKPGLDLVGEI